MILKSAFFSKVWIVLIIVLFTHSTGYGQVNANNAQKSIEILLTHFAKMDAKRKLASKTQKQIDFTSNFAKFKEEAENGDVEAQFHLSQMYIRSKDFIEEYSTRDERVKKTMFWLEQAAEKGHIEANYELGSMYASSIYLKKDEAKAKPYLLFAAERNHAAAQFELSIILMFGALSDPDLHHEAVKWAKKSYEQDYLPAFDHYLALNKVSHHKHLSFEDILAVRERRFLFGNVDSLFLNALEYFETKKSPEEIRAGFLKYGLIYKKFAKYADAHLTSEDRVEIIDKITERWEPYMADNELALIEETANQWLLDKTSNLE